MRLTVCHNIFMPKTMKEYYEGQTKITVYIPDDLKKSFDIHCATTGEKKREIIIQLLSLFLEKK